MTMSEILSKDNKFKYMLLDRMKQDCNYYLKNGKRMDKYLWAGDKTTHIDYMKRIWDSFSEEEKPEWLSMDDIIIYEMRMGLTPVIPRDAIKRILDSAAGKVYRDELSMDEYFSFSYELEHVVLPNVSEKTSKNANLIFETAEEDDDKIMLGGFSLAGWDFAVRMLNVRYADGDAINMFANNDEEMTIFSFCEGDMYLNCYKNKEAYERELASWYKFFKEER